MHIVSHPGLTFDDILLIPRYTDFSRDDISLQTRLTKKITLDLPFVSSPMDTVSEERMALAMAQLGGISIIHRYLSVADQVALIAKITSAGHLVGAAIGASQGYVDRARALVEVGCPIIIVDAAHGHTRPVLDAIKTIKSNYPHIEVISGNIATYDAAVASIEAGADALRVGMGPGAICTTRVISGMGVPQITALLEVSRAAAPHKIPVIADGGIKQIGDMVKAFAAGASTVMCGSYLAGTDEAPGEIIEKNGKQYKTYRGMGSEAAMRHGAKVKSEDEYHGKSYADRILVAEGVEGLVPCKGPVKNLIDQAVGGIKSGLFYTGCKSLPQLHDTAAAIQITSASLKESHAHSLVEVTNAGKSYQ
jgi:IMP dehydrogenase